MWWQYKEHEASRAPKDPRSHGTKGQPQPEPRCDYSKQNNDTTTKISKLSNKKQINDKMGNMRNITNGEGRSRKVVTTSNRKRSAISSESIHRKKRDRREERDEESEDM
jgi:hypothetical protein